MGIDHTPFDLIQKLRSWFFASDRDIELGTGLSLITQNGTDVEAALGASFITRDSETQLNDEYVLIAGTGITITFGAGTVTIAHDATAGIVPSNGVIFWPSTAGAIPSGWSTFSAASGKVLFGTDAGTFTNGSTGGAETINIEHGHASGTLATDSDSHTHGSGSLATDSDSHTHGSGSLATDSDSHTHGSGSLGSDTDTHDHGFSSNFAVGNESAIKEVQSGTGQFVARGEASLHHIHIVSASSLASSIDTDGHSHNVNSGVTASDGHSHNVNTGATASDNHSHNVNSGATASDGHSHSVTSGTSANTLSTVQPILNPYLVGTWIQKD